MKSKRPKLINKLIDGNWLPNHLEKTEARLAKVERVLKRIERLKRYEDRNMTASSTQEVLERAAKMLRRALK